MSKKKRLGIIVLSILTVLTLAFIFGNSMANKSQSSEISSGVYDVFKPFFDRIFGENVITHAVIRKLAHMGEFFILGIEVCSLFILIFINTIKSFLLSLPIGLIVGIIDETIQIFSNRGASIIDVLIDYSGYMILWIIYFVICIIVNANKKVVAK